MAKPKFQKRLDVNSCSAQHFRDFSPSVLKTTRKHFRLEAQFHVICADGEQCLRCGSRHDFVCKYEFNVLTARKNLIILYLEHM